MDLDSLDYDRDITIDPDSLDVEWLDQSNLMLDYSLAQDDAGQERDDTKLEMEKAHDRIKITKAEVMLDVRRDPDKYNLDKVTETSGVAAVEASEQVAQVREEYYKTVKDFNKAKYTFNKLHSAVKAFEQRKTALESLVRLLGMQYFAAPNVERNLGEEYKKYRYKKTAHTKKQAREKIKERRRTK